MNDLMVAVERAVRPVRASGGRKDRMREELLAHLTAIYEEERGRLGDEAAARAEALRRFGDPATLTAELQASVPGKDRVAYELERWFGWHAPESAAQYTFRVAVVVFFLSIVLGGLTFAFVALAEGQMPDGLQRLRIVMSFLALNSVAVFALGLLYFKLRDALLARAGVTRSRLRAAGIALLFVLVAAALGPLFTLLALGNAALSLEILWPQFLLLGPVFLLCAVVAALWHGPAEIRHTEWECLDLGVSA